MGVHLPEISPSRGEHSGVLPQIEHSGTTGGEGGRDRHGDDGALSQGDGDSAPAFDAELVGVRKRDRGGTRNKPNTNTYEHYASRQSLTAAAAVARREHGAAERRRRKGEKEDESRQAEREDSQARVVGRKRRLPHPVPRAAASASPPPPDPRQQGLRDREEQGAEGGEEFLGKDDPRLKPFLDADKQEKRRRRLWMEIRHFHKVASEKPYRYRSLENAMLKLGGAGVTVAKSAFVSAVMQEFVFDRKLRMDVHLESMYDSCDRGRGGGEAHTSSSSSSSSSFSCPSPSSCGPSSGSACSHHHAQDQGGKDGSVDYRDILCRLRIVELYPMIRDKPRQLLLSFLETYAPRSAQHRPSTSTSTTNTLDWSWREDCLAIFRLPSITAEEERQCSARVEQKLNEAAAVLGLKRKFKKLSHGLLLEILENNSSIMETFREQMWKRLPSSYRLEVLKGLEGEPFDKLNHRLAGMKLTRAVNWHVRTLKKHFFVEWAHFLDARREMKLQLRQVGQRRVRLALSFWLGKAAGKARMRKLRQRAEQMGRLRVLRLRFSRIVQLVHIQLKLKGLSWTCSKAGKEIVRGGAVLRHVCNKVDKRKLVYRWYETASLMSAWEHCASLADTRLLRSHFLAFRDEARRVVAQRNEEDRLTRRADQIAQEIRLAEEKLQREEEEAKEAEVRRKIEAKAAKMAEASYQAKMRQQKEEAVQAARDRKVLASQREQRRKRVYEETVELTKAFEERWAVESAAEVQQMRDSYKAMLATAKEVSAVQYMVEKALLTLKEAFHAAPTIENLAREKLLANPSNQVMASISSMLYQKEISLKEFFVQYDREGDGYLAYDEFKVMVEAMKIPEMTTEKIRGIQRTIDRDESGFIDYPELQEAMDVHEEMCGFPGSAWKMYVEPKHAIMTLYNIETKQELWDYKATEEELLEVAKDILLGKQESDMREKVKAKKPGEWERVLQDRAAKVLQKMYRRWHGAKDRALQRWRFDVEERRIQAEKEESNARKLTCWWRCLRAVWYARGRIALTMQLLVDPSTKALFYFNASTKEASWSTPPFLHRLLRTGRIKRREDVLQEPHEWVFVDRGGSANSYYFNRRSGDVEEERPPGYIPCQSCNIQLATRKCLSEGRSLCFLCYRREHSTAPNQWRHAWEAVTIHPCAVCTVRDAVLVCRVCGGGGGQELCKACHKRTHSYGDFADHQVCSMEEWAEESRAECDKNDDNSSCWYAAYNQDGSKIGGYWEGLTLGDFHEASEEQEEGEGGQLVIQPGGGGGEENGVATLEAAVGEVIQQEEEEEEEQQQQSSFLPLEAAQLEAAEEEGGGGGEQGLQERMAVYQADEEGYAGAASFGTA